MKPQVREALRRSRARDFSFAQGRILGSMCTLPHPAAVEAFTQFMETNLGDPELFPGTQELECKAVERLGHWLHAPAGMGGRMTSGGTESNLTALWIFTSLTGKREVVVPQHAHFSFAKAASLMQVKIKDLPLRNQVADARRLQQTLTPDTACVVGVAGTTNLGLVDPIEEMSEMCREEHVPLHVDAAFGGLVIPFLRSLGKTERRFDFELPGVSSVAVDPHKMGLSVIPSGMLLLREERWWEEIAVASACTHTQRQVSLLGTRPGGAAAATYAVLEELGWEGYREVVRSCMETTEYAARMVEEAGFSLAARPELNLLGVQVTHPQEVATRLSEKNWKVGVDPARGCIRIVCMPHVKKTLIDDFVSDLRSVTA